MTDEERKEFDELKDKVEDDHKLILKLEDIIDELTHLLNRKCEFSYEASRRIERINDDIADIRRSTDWSYDEDFF